MLQLPTPTSIILAVQSRPLLIRRLPRLHGTLVLCRLHLHRHRPHRFHRRGASPHICDLFLSRQLVVPLAPLLPSWLLRSPRGGSGAGGWRVVEGGRRSLDRVHLLGAPSGAPPPDQPGHEGDTERAPEERLLACVQLRRLPEDGDGRRRWWKVLDGSAVLGSTLHRRGRGGSCKSSVVVCIDAHTRAADPLADQPMRRRRGRRTRRARGRWRGWRRWGRRGRGGLSARRWG